MKRLSVASLTMARNVGSIVPPSYLLSRNMRTQATKSCVSSRNFTNVNINMYNQRQQPTYFGISRKRYFSSDNGQEHENTGNTIDYMQYISTVHQYTQATNKTSI